MPANPPLLQQPGQRARVRRNACCKKRACATRSPTSLRRRRLARGPRTPPLLACNRRSFPEASLRAASGSQPSTRGTTSPVGSSIARSAKRPPPGLPDAEAADFPSVKCSKSRRDKDSLSILAHHLGRVSVPLHELPDACPSASVSVSPRSHEPPAEPSICEIDPTAAATGTLVAPCSLAKTSSLL